MALTQFDRFRMEQLKALKQVALHIGMIGNLRRPPVLTDEYELQCLAAIQIIEHPDASLIQRLACAAILDYLLPEWRNIVPPETLGIVLDRDDKEVAAWRKRVLDRDEHACVRCESTEQLQVHHIAHWADSPELRIVDDNGETLCIECHALEHGNISGFILSNAR